MFGKWNLLQLGTRIKFQDGQGTIKDYFRQKGEQGEKEITGYEVEQENGGRIYIAPDGEFEVLG